MVFEIRRYISDDGADVFGRWLDALADVRAKARINARIARVAVGNLGDCRHLRDGVSE